MGGAACSHRLFKINVELDWFERHALGREYQWEKPPRDDSKPSGSSDADDDGDDGARGRMACARRRALRPGPAPCVAACGKGLRGFAAGGAANLQGGLHGLADVCIMAAP